ncbi:(2Fe-2S)-binding protein [Knoellia aerolata DSM 18566]|uniref:(2Fe-2S)-binding protein n=1 Tax=Knoellia aerolata DSM 18566 TaxID=1385519 RepID=A0A0A0K1C1_9MICO|nr:(2Fe-2S)-binding protein [Knoellia aerolata DSM 18566]
MQHVRLTTTVNGNVVTVHVPPRLTLADLLRDELRLTGTHLGCEHGVCGACTVLVDGDSVRACLMFAVQVEGRQVSTIEGLEACATTARLKEAFTRHHGLQCGFCTPGMLVVATELIDGSDPRVPLTETCVREALSGNACRCTGYQGIVRAVLDAADPSPEGAP